MAYKITGIGLLCGLGTSPREVFNRMCAGGNAFRSIHSFDASRYQQGIAGQLAPEDDEKLASQYEGEDRALAMAKHAAEQALNGKEPLPGCALVLATNFGPMETLQWSWQERLDTGVIDEYTYAPAKDYISRLASELHCGGPAMQISMSCASGASALAVARDILAQGKAPQVLVLAYDSLSEYCWCGLSNLHTITADTMRPFDARRSGTIFSEGAAAMLLECGDSQAPALGWLAGTATNNNAFHLTAPRPEAEGSREVMEAALVQAGLAADAIEHVCAHATSTVANDVTEAAAIRNVFGTGRVSVAAHKSQLGHLLGAAGLAEAVITLMSMRSGLIPPTVNLDEPDPKCMPLDCVGKLAQAKSFCAAITNSAGIGGNNASVVLTKNGAPSALETPGDAYIRNVGWVLPGGVGAGLEGLAKNAELRHGGGLDNFSAKPYITSVKGYMDPAGAYFLAAAKLALGQAKYSRLGIVSASYYGSQKSAYTFYCQMAQKGPRLASPMIFPHGYSNTPGNLAAMEFGAGGPHLVFYGRQDIGAAFEFARARLYDGTADAMLLGLYEATVPQAMPDGLRPTNGAVVFLLTKEAEGAPTAPFNHGTTMAAGAVDAALDCLS